MQSTQEFNEEWERLASIVIDDEKPVQKPWNWKMSEDTFLVCLAILEEPVVGGQYFNLIFRPRPEEPKGVSMNCFCC